MGHQVTLFASGDSQTKARLVAGSERSLRLNPGCRDQLAHHVRLIELVAQRASQFDVLHFHTGFLHMPLAQRLGRPHLTTLHGRLDIADLKPLMREFATLPLVSISDAQRTPLPALNWRGTVHHGIPGHLLPFSPTARGYLAFVGRISPEKRVDRAIEIARRAGRPLRIAAKVDKADRGYFADVIQPLLDDPMVSYLGEIDEAAKAVLLGGAEALLFPIDWPEPFGMVVIEAMSCGTPVIAWNEGSVPELIDPGVTGWIVTSLDDAVAAANAARHADRHACRAVFERRFLAERMARDYVAIYGALTRSKDYGLLEEVSA